MIARFKLSEETTPTDGVSKYDYAVPEENSSILKNRVMQLTGMDLDDDDQAFLDDLDDKY